MVCDHWNGRACGAFEFFFSSCAGDKEHCITVEAAQGLDARMRSLCMYSVPRCQTCPVHSEKDGCLVVRSFRRDITGRGLNLTKTKDRTRYKDVYEILTEKER